MSHTPTPWMYQERGPREVKLLRVHYEIGSQANGEGIGLAFGDDEVNAEHIVRCVNSHDALVEALLEAQMELLHVAGGQGKPEAAKDMLPRIRDALNLADGLTGSQPAGQGD